MGANVVGDRARRAYDVVASSRSAETIEELDALIGAAFKDLGFETFVGFEAIGADGRPNLSLLFGHGPLEWVEHHQKERYITDDAVVRSMLQSDEPMFWSDLKRDRPISPRAKLIMDEAAEFGLKDGFVTPIHQTDGSIAGVQLTGQHLDPNDDDLRTTAFLLSMHYAGLCRKLMRKKAQAPMIKPLTARQIECLRWVRDGKSSHDIGDILKISEHTVTEYINEACARLGVRSRTQAVVEAGLRNLIQL